MENLKRKKNQIFYPLTTYTIFMFPLHHISPWLCHLSLPRMSSCHSFVHKTPIPLRKVSITIPILQMAKLKFSELLEVIWDCGPEIQTQICLSENPTSFYHTMPHSYTEHATQSHRVHQTILLSLVAYARVLLTGLLAHVRSPMPVE